ncbi:MAG: hypothetical protein KDK70_20275 [Myxococcales bacterium]|nr:hypothetical protein [Myxococcales bacterium]
MKQPYYDMYMCLMKENWQDWGRWRYGVKAKPGEAIYIGTDQDHITILANTNGYHRTIDRQTGRQDTSITRVPELYFASNGQGFSAETTRALEWFWDHVTIEY